MMMGEVLVGGTNIRKTSSNLCIADTGTSLLTMLESDFVGFADMVTQASPDFICNDANAACYSYNNTCDVYWPSLKDMTFNLGSNMYTITPEGYSLPYDSAFGPNFPLCVLGVSYIPDADGLFILGDTFLRNFVVTFDYVANTIQFAVNANAPAGTTITSNSSTTGLSTAAIVGIIAGSLIVVGVVVGLIMYQRNKKKNAMEKRVWRESERQPLAE
jgi:Eukaryotic aspartyl protease